MATPKSAAKTASSKTSGKADKAKTSTAKPAEKPAAKAAPAKAQASATPAKSKPAKIAPAPAKAPPAKAAKPAPAGKAEGKKIAAPVKPMLAKAISGSPPKPAEITAAKAPVAKAGKAPATPASPMKSAEPKAAPIPAVQPVAKAPAKPSSKAKKTVNGKALTEADLLAMSEDDYMNEAQLAFFRAKLEAMRSEMLENARATGEHLKENEVFADPNDRATVAEEHTPGQRVRDRERKLLKKIESTLNRIESGDYGYCKETGDPIGIPRLLARPTADLSIEAQEKHERLEKLYAD